jgi:hypothetical protein
VGGFEEELGESGQGRGTVLMNGDIERCLGVICVRGVWVGERKDFM